ncbi:flagellar hook assembly protein FlgD [Stappia indica]|uniref:Basal-body rod modification protein FlgD n=1 Tax=Stappia indica TaxID=538381 RepID=A0A285R9M5_9HYPH|nr:flagellar hook capping FlgD N-terminal domain-containing protein [Stappia indica]MCC4242814.1 flagellar hook assembly protein FlgD [Stappia indica]SOB90458.1 flagellar basal-body rod modification protein FlgD [Stappia indica]
MATSGISGSGGSGGATTTSSSLTALSNNYELFLSILTTQIQNQDPLNPMDSSKYTEQLVQYSSVEQQIKTNDQLGDLLSVMAATTASSYVSYLGTNVTAAGNTTSLKDGEAEWTYDTPEAGKARVEVRNNLGAVIFSEDADLSYGRNTYSWDGRTTAGSTAPDGEYTISIARYDANNRPTVPVATEISGTVDGIEFTSSGAVLQIGGVYVSASSVLSVNRD